MTAFLACITVWTASLVLVVITSRWADHILKARNQRIAEMEADLGHIGSQLLNMMDRIGSARSLSVELQIAYAMGEKLLQDYYGDRYEPMSWRERRFLIGDMREQAQANYDSTKDEDKPAALINLRAINEMANHLERYPYRGASCR